MEGITNHFLSDRYQMVDLLKEDSYSRVLIVRHKKLEILRVIKQIFKNTPQTENLIQEAYLLKRLHHKTIPSLIDVEEDDKDFYLIEEFIAGDSLQKLLLHQKKLSLNLLNQIMESVCQSLAYLHSCCPPIIYNDLKPEHIYICGNEIKLIDFGAATYIGESKMGFTPFFAAPENLSGKDGTISSDIYMLGATLKYLSTYLEVIPNRIRSAVNIAMKYEPSERFQCVEDFLLAIREETNMKKQDEHLLKINVVGTKTGAGTTHVAVSLSCAIGATQRCVYQYNPGGNTDFTYHHNVSAMGFSVISGEENPPEDASVLVIDKGAFDFKDELEIDENECLILVAGFKDWERDNAFEIIKKLSHRKNLFVFCNYGDVKAAKEIAKIFHIKVFVFPLDVDPYCVTKEKQGLLKLLKVRR